MRLEVLVDSEEPVIYPINKNKLVIGSAETADIIINVDGVSRKHLLLATEGEQFSVIDQGSTNGTYINEERLIPGKKVEFTSFFPVRLGDRVLLSLLSDDEDSPFSSLQNAIKKERTNPMMKSPLESEENSSTRMINLKQLQQSQATKKLTEQRKKVIQDKRAGRPIGKAKKSEADKQRMVLTQLIVGILVLGAVYYQFFRETDVTVATPVVEKKTKDLEVPTDSKRPELGQSQVVLVPESDLLAIDTIDKLAQEIKCTTASEKALCELFFPDGVGKFDGVVESPGFMNVFILEDPYYQQARQQMGILTPEELQKSPYSSLDWKKMAYVIFVTTKLASIPQDKFPDKPINYIFVYTAADQMKVNGVMTIRKENFPMLLKSITPNSFKMIKEYGLFVLDPISQYMQVY